jgi:hypothetical protein
MSAAKAVTAEFGLETHLLSVSKSGNGSGTVTSSPAGINCGGTCSAAFNHNAEVTLTPVPDPGSEFKGWSGACSGTGACKVTISAARSVSAEFGLEAHLLSISKSGNGSGAVTSSPVGISCGTTCSASFSHGAEVTLTHSADSGSEFKGWSGACSGTGACKVTMSAARSVSAEFGLEKRSLSVTLGGNGSGSVSSSPAGIACGSTCSHEYDFGASVALTGTPTPGSHTSAVKWAGCDSVNGANECIVAMAAVKSVTATFALEQHQLSVAKSGNGGGSVTSSPAGIECGEICSLGFDHGTQVTLTATASAGSEFKEWSGCDSVVGSQCKVAMSAAKAVDVEFDLIPGKVLLDVSRGGNGSGTVTSSPAGIACGGVCEAGFTEGAVVTLTAAAAPGSHFSAWTGCASEPSPTECKVTMSAAKAVTAEFGLETHLLSVSKSGNGSGTVTSSPAGINCGGTCSAAFNHNAEVTLTPVPDPGSEFKGWSGACSGTGACKVTMSAAKTVTAEFGLEQHQLSVSKTGSGTGTVTSSPAGINCGGTCSAAFNHNAEVTLTAAFGGGTKAVAWTGCASEPSPTECKVTMSAAKAVTAEFKVEQHMLSVTKTGGSGTVTSSPAGIECGLACAAEFDHGAEVTLVATAEGGSEFKEWNGCDSVVGNQCKVTMSAAKSVEAKFELLPGQALLKLRRVGPGTATVTSSPAGIDCGTTCETSGIGEGAAVVLKVASFGPHTIEAVAWTGCASEPSPTECEVTLGSAATEVRAKFTLEQRQLSVTKGGSGAGTVVSAPARIDCGGTCSAGFDYGSEVTLIAAAADGSKFSGWSGACAGAMGCRVMVDAAKTVAATFDALADTSQGGSQLPEGGEQAQSGGKNEAEKLKQALKRCKKLKRRARAQCVRSASSKAKGRPKRHRRGRDGHKPRSTKGDR